MIDTTSPVWWVLAAGTAALYLAVMFRGMVTRGQKIFVSCGPVAGFLALAAMSAHYGWPLAEMLPYYCAVNMGVVTGMLGHRKALHSYMADRAENPNLPEDGTATPWILQMAFTLPVFLGLAFWYMRG
ncbi:hypothetical protein ACFVFF_38400 [Streptomyces sp. NPDC057680]|uniref:hypothetical protein n=1 Tax=Streptomyces sp. NPDC057680 TaxID=3346208 RepID=UPI003676607A